MTDAQTEARTIARASLWIPAKPEHAKIGWSYDFEQTERIARAAYDSTGYDATMEVVEFVMAEADRRHSDALAAKDAELVEKNRLLEIALRETAPARDAAIARAERAEAQLAEARKALEPFAAVADEWNGKPPSLHISLEWNDDGAPVPHLLVEDFRAARRALTGGKKDG